MDEPVTPRRTAMLTTARLQPITRRATMAGLFASLGMLPAGIQASERPFSDFVRSLWPEAHARGVSRSTFEAAFNGVEPDPDVIAKTHKQAEFVKTTGEYLSTAVSDKRIAAGSARYGEWASWLGKSEQRF